MSKVPCSLLQAGFTPIRIRLSIHPDDLEATSREPSISTGHIDNIAFETLRTGWWLKRYNACPASVRP
jgi:hypothetical protein